MEKIVNFIKQYTKNCTFEAIHNKKLDKELLFAYIGGPREKIMVYDILCEKEIAKISYVLNNKGVYISEFVVDSEYQQNGIGKTLFNMVACRGLLLDKKLVYGIASPTDELKDFAGNDEDFTFDEEKRVIAQIYQKLGCEVLLIDKENHFTFKIAKDAKFDKRIVKFINKIQKLNNKNEDKVK